MSFWKHKLFTLINITGLSIGIGTSVVIYLAKLYPALSYDQIIGKVITYIKTTVSGIVQK